MNKYSDKSDFEINKAVFAAVKINHEDIDLRNGKVLYGNGANWIEFDPCHNPADAMPIIIENKICLTVGDSDDIWVADTTRSLESSFNENPLRAAMEVFLMMKDAENES